jgi:hypothetical protein
MHDRGVSDTPIDESQDEAAKAALRELLAKLDLSPEQTSDDVVQLAPRDEELRDNVPPHHG